jgi:hypothetical protein
VADLNTLALGTFTDVGSTAITGAEPVLQEVASASDTTNVHDTANTTHTGIAQFTLEDVNADLGNVDTLFIRLRYALSATADLNVWNSLSARVFKSDGTTPLTDSVVVVAGPITTTTPTNSSVVEFTGVDTAASKDDWNGAVVQISFAITKNKGGDAVEERVFAAELTGTYTVAVAGPNTGSATGGIAWVGSADGSAGHEGASSGSVSWVGAADGVASHQGSASGSVLWAGSATGQAPTGASEGSASGSIIWSGTADGATTREGAGSGAIAWVGSADGAVDHEGAATGTVIWVGSADGSVGHEGANTGAVSWSGSATGEAPTVQQDGTASGSITWVGSADGTAAYEASASGNIAWSGTATGAASHEGSVSGTVTWVGAASGASDLSPSGLRQAARVRVIPPPRIVRVDVAGRQQ